MSGAPCGIPSSSFAISVNITVFDITGATGNGVFKVGIVAPPTTAWINYPPSETQRANAGIVSTDAADGSGNIAVQVNQGAGSVDFTVDVNGYYYNGLVADMPVGDIFGVSGDKAGGGVLVGVNQETSVAGSTGVNGVTNSSGSNSAGVFGIAGAGLTYGVFGLNFSTTFNAAGVHGEANGNGQTIGVEGVCASGPPGSLCTGAAGRGIGGGGYFTGSGDGGYGVHGIATSTSGIGFGVIGNESSTALDSAGVRGMDASGAPAPLGSTGYTPTGVRGESTTGVGTLGVSRFEGVAGTRVDSSGTLVAGGILGCSSGGCAGGPWGVFAIGTLGATGAKSFVKVHPTDPTKVIRYVSLEGPEAGTYFRGTEETRNGMAVIQVPESFRLVTDSEGLTVQLTPLGELATMAVVSEDLNQIVVRSSHDVKFHYLVNGVRQTFKDWQVIVDGGYMPESPRQKLPASFSDEQKRRLVANGTYNADGTVNMTTAERVGWTKIWEDREAQARAAAAVEAQRTADGDRR